MTLAKKIAQSSTRQSVEPFNPLTDSRNTAFARKREMTETLWTIGMVAEYLVVSEAAAGHTVAEFDFPAPIVLPSRGTGARQIKRWLPEDVREWVRTRKIAA